MAKRIIAFVDGFNLYHSLDDNSFHKYKWLDLVKLCQKFLNKDSELTKVYYFTALTYWNEEKSKRHQLYLSALESKNIEIIHGRFQKVSKRCNKCHNVYFTFEEKKTDVNIAIHLLKLAARNEYDEAIIISGDSDLRPAIDAVREIHSKQIKVIIPFGGRAEELKLSSDSYHKVQESHLQLSVFPKSVEIRSGIFIECPISWQSNTL